MENKKKSLLIHIITPFIVLLFCGAIVVVGLIKPYDKLKMYMNLAFMDELKSTPESKSSGLVIKPFPFTGEAVPSFLSLADVRLQARWSSVTRAIRS